MSRYKILPAHLHSIADAAEVVIKTKYGLSTTHTESAIDKDIPWTPTFHWITKTGIIACEVHESPMPITVKSVFGEIVATGLPIKIIIAHPINGHSTQEYLKLCSEAKKFGLGLLAINDDKTSHFQHNGIDLSLHLPVPKYSEFASTIRAEVQHAFELYINGDPRHGVQELGQLIENIIMNVGFQAKKKGNLVKSKFPPPEGKFFPQATLIEDLMKEKILDNALLGRCRGYVEDRNISSHKPTTIKKTQAFYNKLKNAMSDGLRILEALPSEVKEKGYKIKISS